MLDVPLGSFLSGGAYTSMPSIAGAGLAATFLAALVVVSVVVKALIGTSLAAGGNAAVELRPIEVQRHGRLPCRLACRA